MNLNSLLSQALNSDLLNSDMLKQGSEKLKQGTGSLSETINNQSNLTTLGAGAVGGGIIGLLMGSKKARKMGKTALGVGGAAALGAVAFKVYKDWSNKQPPSEPSNSAAPQDSAQSQIPEVASQQLNEEQHSVLILKAMIAAAKADGHVDAQEQQKIEQAVAALGADESVSRLVAKELDKPLDPSEVAKHAATPEQASEIYLASLIVVDQQNFMEKAYLKELATQLGLEESLVAQLESQIQPA